MSRNIALLPIALLVQYSLGQMPSQSSRNVTYTTPKVKSHPKMGYIPPIIPPSNLQKQHQFILKQAKQYKNRQAESRKAVREALEDSKPRGYSIKLPSKNGITSTVYYREAFEQLKQMKDSNFSIKTANFIVENAYYENKGKQETFDTLIRQIGTFLNLILEESGYNNSNLSKNLILLRFFSDTLKTKSGLEHLPFKYEFEDYLGDKDWSKMFVTKLLVSNKGQCHSLPLLYLMLADEIGATAYLSFSPNHSYIKFQDDKGKWYNVELTNGMLTTDAFVLRSGYVKSEALHNKVYMNPLSESQLLSQIMIDLAQGYLAKYGYDSFVEQVIRESIKLHPNNINAQMMLSNYLTVNFRYVQRQLNLNPRNIDRYPEARELFLTLLKQYKKIEELGYAEMPVEDYKKWLKSLEDAKQKQESESILLELNKVIELK